MKIEIPADLQSFVDEEFSTGCYTSKEEVLVHALRGLKREREEAVAGIRAGLDDVAAGRVQPLGEAFGDLRKEFGVLDS